MALFIEQDGHVAHTEEICTADRVGCEQAHGDGSNENHKDVLWSSGVWPFRDEA